MQTLEESTLGEPFADDEEGGDAETREKHRVRLQTSQKQRDIERRLNIDGAGEFADECSDEMLRAVNKARTLEQRDRRELLRKLQEPMNAELVVPNPDPAQEAVDCKKGTATLFFSQEIRVALPNKPLGDILKLIGSGIFAKRGFYLHAMDFTADCAGVVRKWPSAREPPEDEPPALVPALLGTGKYRMKIEGRWDQTDAIVKNDQQVGRNCTTVLCTSARIGHGDQMCRRRDKIYSKPINNMEKRTLRKRTGHHIQTSHNLMFERVAFGFDSTVSTGYSRAETTIYVDRPFRQPWLNYQCVPPSIADVEAELDEVVSMVPTECVIRTPHSQLFINWCKNIHHSLVVVDARYDRALVVLAINSVTGCVPATEISGWSRKYRFVLERLTLGRAPIDVITLHRGKSYKKEKKYNCCKRKSRREGTRAPKKQKRTEATEAEMGCRDEDRDPERDAESGAAASALRGPTTEARTVTSTGRAEDHDTEKDHYIPGFFQPEGEDDCIVTSQRFVRLPLYVDQVTACGDFLPTTRFFSAHLGRGFQPGAYPYPDPADRKAPEGEQKGPYPLPAGWNGDGSKVSMAGVVSERYTDKHLAAVTLKRAGMQPNAYIVTENWTNLSHKKKPKYVHLSHVDSKLPINLRSILRKEALDMLGRETEEGRLDRMRQSIVAASTEREALLATRIRALVVRDTVTRLKFGCQPNGGGHRSDSIPSGPHEVVAIEVVRATANSDRRNVKLHLHSPPSPSSDEAAATNASAPRTKAYSTPNVFSDAVVAKCNIMGPLLYTAPNADGGNDFYIHADDRPIGTLFMPASGGLLASTLSVVVNGETVELVTSFATRSSVSNDDDTKSSPAGFDDNSSPEREPIQNLPSNAIIGGIALPISVSACLDRRKNWYSAGKL